MASPNSAGRSLQKWDTLTPDEKKLFIRQADVFAAYTAYTDYEIGRVIQAVEDAGQARQHADHLYQWRQRHAAPKDPSSAPRTIWPRSKASTFRSPDQLKFYDVWGSAETTPHMAVGWTWAFDTPFKWTKQVASHFGGTRQGMAISWPGHINGSSAASARSFTT